MKTSHQNKSKVLLALLALACGMVLQPLCLNAASALATEVADDANVSVTIEPKLTLDLSTNSVTIETKTNDVMTGAFTAAVTSNKPYTISLNAKSTESDGTSLTYKEGNTKLGEIPAISGATQPQAGTNGWGIRTCTGVTESTCTGTYKGLPAHNASAEVSKFYTGNTFGTAQSTMFQIGIGVSSDLSSGTYTTEITVTASQN